MYDRIKKVLYNMWHASGCHTSQFQTPTSTVLFFRDWGGNDIGTPSFAKHAPRTTLNEYKYQIELLQQWATTLYWGNELNSGSQE